MRLFPAVFSAIALCLFLATPVAAKGIRVPGLQLQAATEVLDLPDTSTFQRDNAYIDLAYLHHAFGNGEWIGQLDGTDKYMVFDEDQLPIILAAAGVSTRPNIPAKPMSIHATEWLAYGTGLLLAFGFLRNVLSGSHRRATRNEPLASELAATMPPPDFASRDTLRPAQRSFGKRQV